MQQWEYIVVYMDEGGEPYIDKLNELGKEGWELAIVTHYSQMGRGVYWGSVILKRPKQPNYDAPPTFKRQPGGEYKRVYDD